MDIIYLLIIAVADPDKAFGGGQSNWGAPKRSSLTKYRRLSAKIIVCHT